MFGESSAYRKNRTGKLNDKYYWPITAVIGRYCVYSCVYNNIICPYRISIGEWSVKLYPKMRFKSKCRRGQREFISIVYCI